MNDLYKGIFWITEPDDLTQDQPVFRIPVTPMGELIEPDKLDLNSKNVNNYNHRLLWESLPSKVTHNKPFNYYPRGRVEIKRGKAAIYANPNICNENLQEFLINRFGLTQENGIFSVTIKPDGSKHYKCYLDN